MPRRPSGVEAVTMSGRPSPSKSPTASSSPNGRSAVGAQIQPLPAPVAAVEEDDAGPARRRRRPVLPPELRAIPGPSPMATKSARPSRFQSTATMCAGGELGRRPPGLGPARSRVPCSRGRSAPAPATTDQQAAQMDGKGDVQAAVAVEVGDRQRRRSRAAAGIGARPSASSPLCRRRGRSAAAAVPFPRRAVDDVGVTVAIDVGEREAVSPLAASSAARGRRGRTSAARWPGP